MKLINVHTYQPVQLIKKWGTVSTFSRDHAAQKAANLQMELVEGVGVLLSAEHAGDVYTTVVPLSNILSIRLEPVAIKKSKKSKKSEKEDLQIIDDSDIEIF